MLHTIVLEWTNLQGSTKSCDTAASRKRIFFFCPRANSNFSARVSVRSIPNNIRSNYHIFRSNFFRRRKSVLPPRRPNFAAKWPIHYLAATKHWKQQPACVAISRTTTKQQQQQNNNNNETFVTPSYQYLWTHIQYNSYLSCFS